ncbi:NAD(P)-binding domain-containing protein [Streptomyces rhizosphaericus]|uniref:NAD(P)-binding domain-containing protein n=1 Tax=Streptomyces rhizosphaericus TaxID=114699 RepID=UPI00362522A4
MSESPVTVLGLGDMGTALARALLRAGHRTTVWNRTAAKAEALAAEGALTAATVGEAVAASPLVVVCLLDYDSVRQVLAPSGTPCPARPSSTSPTALRGRPVSWPRGRPDTVPSTSTAASWPSRR